MSDIRATTVRDLRNNFKKYADDVADYNETILIPRPENKNVVLISEKEFNSWQETNFFLSDSKLKEKLINSINSLGDGKNTKVITPEEWENMNKDD